MYTNANWFVILLSRVYFGVWVTKIRQYKHEHKTNRLEAHPHNTMQDPYRDQLPTMQEPCRAQLACDTSEETDTT